MRLLSLRILSLLAGVTTLMAAAPPAPPPGSAAGQQRFALAVVRRDGRIVPFASYENGRWRNRWPTVFPRYEEVPLSLNGIPEGWWPWKEPLLTWKVWPLEGTPRPVSVRAPVLFESACDRIMGLATNYQPFASLMRGMSDPFPKDGLATVGDITVEPVETLEKGSPDWDLVTQAVSWDVSQAENQTVAAWSGQWKHPYPSVDRRTKVFNLEVLCRTRATTPGAFTYYFEGIKRYKQLADGKSKLDKDCDFITFAAGWVEISKSNRGKAVVTAELTNCSREGIAYTLPLGQITVDGKVLWVIQLSGRGYEHYEVVEPASGQVKRQIATVGGSCR